MRIQFQSVLLEREITRLGACKGLASSSTARFSVEAGNTIELDTATQLVRISHDKSGAAVKVPVCRVLQFEDLVAPPAA